MSVFDEYGIEMGFCNSCGEESRLDSECCENGEVWPYDDPDATNTTEET